MRSKWACHNGSQHSRLPMPLAAALGEGDSGGAVGSAHCPTDASLLFHSLSLPPVLPLNPGPRLPEHDQPTARRTFVLLSVQFTVDVHVRGLPGLRNAAQLRQYVVLQSCGPVIGRTLT